MALVVLLRGVNVGGHRTFRPATLAAQMQHLDVVNIGAAGTFVVLKPAGRVQVRAEFERRLPFHTEIIICDGREIVNLVSRDRFPSYADRPDIVRFVSVLSKAPRTAPPTPLRFPPSGQWLMNILAREGRFVFGVYRRQMKAINSLGKLDHMFGVPLTTRNWNTIAAIVKALDRDADHTSSRKR